MNKSVISSESTSNQQLTNDKFDKNSEIIEVNPIKEDSLTKIYLWGLQLFLYL